MSSLLTLNVIIFSVFCILNFIEGETKSVTVRQAWSELKGRGTGILVTGAYKRED